jgi:hypothetical protein
VEQIWFEIEISATKDSENSPTGYLFLPPTNDLKPRSFGWPERPAYWSLDPAGLKSLSADEATRLGFPSIQLTTEVCGAFWPASVYIGLGQFHRMKGFDPKGLEVAQHCGHQLYQLSSEENRTFAGKFPIPCNLVSSYNR